MRVLRRIGYGLIYLAPSKLTYIVAICCILPFGGALFSQCFSFSRAYYNAPSPDRAEFMMSVLRTLFAVSCVIVPPVAGWIAATYTIFDVSAAAAIAHIACTLIFGLLINPDARIGTEGNQAHGGAPERWHIPAQSNIMSI